MNEKRILRSVSADSAALSLPGGPVAISQLHIGRTTEEYSVLVNGTQSARSEDRFDVGLDVENAGTAPVRVGFTISRADADGFVTRKYPVSAVVQPGEKRRVWADLRVEHQEDFRRLILADVWVEPASAQSGSAVNPVQSSPRLNLHTLFGLHQTRLPFRLKQEHAVPLLVAAIVLIVLGYLSFDGTRYSSGTARPVSEKERREEIEKRRIGQVDESAMRCEDGILTLSVDSVPTRMAMNNGGTSSSGRLGLDWDSEPATHVMDFRVSSFMLEAVRENDKEYLIRTTENGIQRFHSAATDCWGASYTAASDMKAPIRVKVVPGMR